MDVGGSGLCCAGVVALNLAARDSASDPVSLDARPAEYARCLTLGFSEDSARNVGVIVDADVDVEGVLGRQGYFALGNDR